MPLALWLILAFFALLAAAWLSRILLVNPRADVEAGVIWHAARLYARVFHRMRLIGVENLPRGRTGPLIIIANHTAGVDPALIQAACPFEIRWMMDADMRHPAGEFLWQFLRIIFVEHGGRELASAREAIRHLEAGGVLGIFPEGGIERPARTILPFLGGIGLIVRKTGAPVLPFIIDGTPIAEPAWATLYRFSHARLRVMPPIDYSKSGLGAAEITVDLHRRFVEWTEWPAAPSAPMSGNSRA